MLSNCASEKEVINKLTNERIDKERAAKKKLLESLKIEEKLAQKNGNLALTNELRNRIAELESTNAADPFSGKKREVESQPVKGSQAEKIFEAEIKALRKEFSAKANVVVNQMKSRLTSLTKAGKIDEANNLDALIVEILDEHKIEESNLSRYVGIWVKQDTGSILELKADMTCRMSKADLKNSTPGTWKIEDNMLYIVLADRTVTLKQTAEGTFLGSDSVTNKDNWDLRKKE
jgi:hypothetical protein